eukprot:m.308310 g.308310  ORF g.308310 m.308310 type:complete len:358 (+) comp43738_c0_seq1:196-1269(+)
MSFAKIVAFFAGLASMLPLLKGGEQSCDFPRLESVNLLYPPVKVVVVRDHIETIDPNPVIIVRKGEMLALRIVMISDPDAHQKSTHDAKATVTFNGSDSDLYITCVDEHLNEKGISVLFDPVDIRHSGNYSLNVGYGNRAVSYSIRLIVLAEPVKHSIMVESGSLLTLNCSAYSQSTKWRYHKDHYLKHEGLTLQLTLNASTKIECGVPSFKSPDTFMTYDEFEVTVKDPPDERAGKSTTPYLSNTLPSSTPSHGYNNIHYLRQYIVFSTAPGVLIALTVAIVIFIYSRCKKRRKETSLNTQGKTESKTSVGGDEHRQPSSLVQLELNNLKQNEVLQMLGELLEMRPRHVKVIGTSV